ncbi:MAG: tRNA pseudouridine(55) synthase TruB [Simkaniaceae bacterium]|nr:tRNA pseudouridine(55) synthase TruB [Simkaniaceae bacterium]
MGEGILLINKKQGQHSFSLVSTLRRLSGIRKIGHAGTLDPFATGVMILLIGKEYTKQSDNFLNHSKAYEATLKLGETTDSYDCDGTLTTSSPLIPEDIESVLATFQGTTEQIPPMFSAKKIGGKRLYLLARQGIEIERAPVSVTMDITLLSYHYPYLRLKVACSKGTYIRSLAHDIGQKLGCGAHLTQLHRIQSGPFRIDQCVDARLLETPLFDYKPYLIA